MRIRHLIFGVVAAVAPSLAAQEPYKQPPEIVRRIGEVPMGDVDVLAARVVQLDHVRIGRCRIGQDFVDHDRDAILAVDVLDRHRTGPPLGFERVLKREIALGRLGAFLADRQRREQLLDRLREQPHRLGVHLDERLRVGQRPPQLVQELPEVGARLSLARIGPELEREARAVLHVSPQRDQRQKPLQAKRVEGAKTPAVQDDLDDTEKPDL